MAKFTPEVETAIRQASQKYGVPESRLRAFARIESGGNPRNQTGSYLGLFQLSQNEFRKAGGQGNIFDPVANANAAAVKLKAEEQQFTRQYGRPPTDGELYMIHQQGIGGAAAHAANPDRPAWQNMYSTGEGRQKGEAWSKLAIWGNVPDDVKRQYGSVDNMTSRQFTDMWNSKVARFGGNGTPATTVAAAQPQQPADGMDAATYGVTAPSVVPATPGGAPDYGPQDSNAYLTAWANQYDESQQKQREQQSKAASSASEALSMANGAARAAPASKADPRQVNIGQLLAALKARGVTTNGGVPELGSDQKSYLGTGRA